MKRILPAALALVVLILPLQALAWGVVGHETVALIARSYLTPKAKARVDEILAADPDTLTGPDMIARSTWADAWRTNHPETFNWHFVDNEIDHSDLKAACYGFPAQEPLASKGPADDCVIDKIDALARELKDKNTAPAERLLALKYLLHFVGDMHQPLHSTDNHDRGGNCVRISLGGTRTSNLHTYWDSTVIDTMTKSAPALATRLESEITPQQKEAWEMGDTKAWALETYDVGRRVTYKVDAKSECDADSAPVTLSTEYEAAAQKAIALQLERAGVRLAKILNDDLT